MRKMKRLEKDTDPIKALRMLAKDDNTRNLLHGVLWHTREERKEFRMKELRRFARQGHDGRCSKTPRVHEDQGKELRWEKTELRVSNLCVMGLLEKTPRQNTSIFDYKLTEFARSLDDFCRYWAASEEDMITALYSIGFKRILKHANAIEPLTRPVGRAGLFPKVEELERSSGWLFSPTGSITVQNWEMGLVPATAKKPSPSSRTVDNLGFVFEDLFSRALDEACPKGWAILICSKNFAKEYFQKGWYIPGPDLNRIGEIKELIEKEMQDRPEVKALLDPLMRVQSSDNKPPNN